MIVVNKRDDMVSSGLGSVVGMSMGSMGWKAFQTKSLDIRDNDSRDADSHQILSQMALIIGLKV